MEQSLVAGFGRYLAGEMDVAERQAFEQSLKEDQQLRAEFLAYQQIWVHSATPDVSWDTESAWAKFEATQNDNRATIRTTRISLYWSIAAAVLVLAGASYFLFLRPSSEVFIYSDAGDNSIELKDGSVVHLNRGSAITVSSFSGSQRKVELSGEAFFEVAPDAHKPFIIHCGKTITEVVGTSFNLRQQADDVMLYVASGKVIFRAADSSKDQALALTAGEAAAFQNDGLHRIPNPNPNVNAWHTRQLWFKGMTMADVITECESYFNKSIRIENEAIKACPVYNTKPFKNPEIKTLLKDIARSMNAEVSMEGDVFVIKGGSSCQ